MRHQIYTVIFMHGINRTWNEQIHIVVACDKFMGAHKYLPVFGIFNYVHCSLSQEGGKSCTMVQYHRPKLVLSNIHDRGMGFGGAHVRKQATHKQWNFCILKNLDPWVVLGAPLPTLYLSKILYLPSLMFKKVCAFSKCTHTLFSLHMFTSCSCRQITSNPRNHIAHRLRYTHACDMAHVIMIK